MPYPHTLAQYTTPDFFAEAPASWERRLREISPVLPGVDHLVFRRFSPHETWNHPERPQWVLYSARPIALVEKGRAAQFATHWSDIPLEHLTDECPFPGGAREARKAVVSNYQHYMWHACGLYVTPFLILQGEWGGTPAKYTEREKRYLDGAGAMSEVPPIGFFPACPFDERVVAQVTARDRLLKACNRFDDLEKMDRPLAKQAEDEAAELSFRETYLKTWAAIVQPQAEFMQSYLRKSESHQALPAAPVGLANTVARWKEHFLETGQILDANTPMNRRLQVSVA